jgi:hypothetical protein
MEVMKLCLLKILIGDGVVDELCVREVELKQNVGTKLFYVSVRSDIDISIWVTFKSS